MGAPVRGADRPRSRSTLDGEERPARRRARAGCVAPTASVRRAPPRRSRAALEPGLRTRAFIFNTLLADKSTDDRLRHYPNWLASRNLVQRGQRRVGAGADRRRSAARYDLPQRWYRLKAKLLGIDRLADYDRMAPRPTEDVTLSTGPRRATSCSTRTSSFSPEAWPRRAPLLRRALDRRAGARRTSAAARSAPTRCRQRAPVRAAQLHRPPPRRADARARARPRRARRARPPPGHLPPGDAADARRDRVGVRRGAHVRPPARRRRRRRRRGWPCSPSDIEGSIATVFRQIAMNRFEHLVHTRRRDEGELSVDRFNELWFETQARAARRLRRDHRRLPHLVVLRPPLHQHARATCTRTRTASCSRCRSTSATARRATAFVPALPGAARDRRLAQPRGARRDRRHRPRRPRLLGLRPRARRGAAARGRGPRRRAAESVPGPAYRSRALLLALDHLDDQSQHLVDSGCLGVAVLERGAPVLDVSLGRELVEVRARDLERHLRVARDAPSSPSAPAARRGTAGCHRGRAARAPRPASAPAAPALHRGTA